MKKWKCSEHSIMWLLQVGLIRVLEVCSARLESVLRICLPSIIHRIMETNRFTEGKVLHQVGTQPGVVHCPLHRERPVVQDLAFTGCFPSHGSVSAYRASSSCLKWHHQCCHGGWRKCTDAKYKISFIKHGTNVGEHIKFGGGSSVQEKAREA